MRIEIDTNTDSKESIRRAIKMLSDFVDSAYTHYNTDEDQDGYNSDYNNQFEGSDSKSYESQKSPQAEGLFNMFGPVNRQGSAGEGSHSSQQPEMIAAGGLFELFNASNENKAGNENQIKSDNAIGDANKDISTTPNKEISPCEPIPYGEGYYRDDHIPGKRAPRKPKKEEIRPKKWQMPEDEISVVDY